MTKFVGASVLVLGGIVTSAIWRGYVLSIMWGWFITATFGIRTLSIPAAIGVSYIFSFMCPTTDCKKDDDKDSPKVMIIKTSARAFSAPALFLLCGYIVKQWM